MTPCPALRRLSRHFFAAWLVLSLVLGGPTAAAEEHRIQEPSTPAPATGEENPRVERVAPAERHGSRSAYVGTNPLAPFTALDHYLFRMFFPFATGLEAGAVAVGGLHLSESHALELRLSGGTAHKAGFSSLVQVEGGWRAFPLAGRPRASGLYAGAHARWLQLRYRHPGERWHTAMLLPVAGYVLDVGHVFVDLRLSQPLWAAGWSSADHTRPATGFILSPAPGISPVLPAFGVTVGWRFEPG